MNPRLLLFLGLAAGCEAETGTLKVDGETSSDDGAAEDDTGASGEDGADGDSGGDSGGTDDDGGTGDEGSDGGDEGSDGGEGGDSGSDEGGDAGSDEGGDDGEEPPPTDYSVTGSFSYTSSTSSISVDSDCTMDVTLYEPSSPRGPLVVLGHGFIRAPANVEGWAAHWASWGLTVAVPALCHSSAFDSDHEANGEEMAALAGLIQAGPVVYAGQSAGGLAAGIAAVEDSDAVGMVGLDPVDALGLGAGIYPASTVPMLGLIGEPSLCNSSANGEGLVESAADGYAVRVTEADHCDFENVTDWVCELACTGTNASFSDAEIQDAIRGMSTAALFDMGSVVTDGWEWLEPGGIYYDGLLTSGQIQGL